MAKRKAAATQALWDLLRQYGEGHIDQSEFLRCGHEIISWADAQIEPESQQSQCHELETPATGEPPHQ